METPWGRADSIETLPNGIVSVCTPSHGGLFVPANLLPRIPERYQLYAEQWSGSRQWYEEDCAWACVAVTFPEQFRPLEVDAARVTLQWIEEKGWWPK